MRAGTFADNAPRHDDFGNAEQLLKKMQKDLAGNNVEVSDAIMKTLKSVSSFMDERVGSIIPDTAEMFNKIGKNQYLSRADTVKDLLATNTVQERSIEWIQENGICLDLIRTGGGFHARFHFGIYNFSPGPF